MTLSRQQRVLVAIGAAGGACAIAVPAALALSHNPTFGQRIIPVHVPSSANVVRFDNHGGVVEAVHHHHSGDPKLRRHGHPITSTVASGHEPEPGDDRGRSTEPGDDRGRGAEPGDDRGRGTEPGDDRNTTSSNEPEPGDDRTTPAPSSSEPEPGDDHGGNRGPGDGSGSSSDNRGPGDGSGSSSDNRGPGGGDDGGHHGGDDGGHHGGGDDDGHHGGGDH